ncbi:hypothetical protein CLU79DRAFT_835556 [Phycomyces nitens]|nr:hypothetical protein CLU79DRAFT_835556 [Phycomyces nitens]
MSETNDVQQSHPTQTAQSPTSPQVQESQEHIPSLAPSAPPIQHEPPAELQTLKEAFPSVEVEVIEAILESQGGQLEASFEALLSISDPNYRPEPVSNTPQLVRQTHQDPQPQRPIPAQQETLHSNERTPPPKPPRPHQHQVNPIQQPLGQPQAYYWTGQQDPSIQNKQPISVEEQMRMDEEFARQLAMEDAGDNYRPQYRKRQRTEDYDDDDDDSIFNFQEIKDEFPVIKEKVIEAGNAAKKKVIDLFNQFKASRTNMSSGSSIPTTNVHYRGLPSDDGDDLLAGDMSALHLSDNDVYAQTRGVARPRASENQTLQEEEQEQEEEELRTNVIHVNPPFVPPVKTQNYNDAWTTEDQLRSDEALARRLANEDLIERGSLGTNTSVTGIRAPSPSHSTPSKASEEPVASPVKVKEKEEEVPYVIGDDDSEDDLVDEDEDNAVTEHPRNKYEQKVDKP